MKLSPAQQQKVEDNMKLVGKVIKDKVHGPNQSGIYSYEDLTQIGYIGLCKAAEYLEPDISGELSAALCIVTKRATPAVQNGIKALRYASNGYSSREIGAKMNASDGKVRMWMTRAKRFLQTQPEILALMEI